MFLSYVTIAIGQISSCGSIHTNLLAAAAVYNGQQLSLAGVLAQLS